MKKMVILLSIAGQSLPSVSVEPVSVQEEIISSVVVIQMEILKLMEEPFSHIQN